ncbi:hypothetical protein [Leifsonia sp. TF02-11]|uniref:hypothetical protein n=1 Tax=Leifsonia sp. TF02-11 TaxID=2815212 RepID=UPI001AA14607|nr:hypothetical protein [Leifsonia sp. TF02-11]MBO1738045.1 hypothetical protein [Leifsonia sp. TF02-11]
MTNIDDSNTTPPGYWFGELNGRLRDRMRDELHDLDLGRRGWRILHTLADGPATAEELAAALPRHGRRGHAGRPDHDERRAPGGDRHGAERGTSHGAASDSASGRREWRGRPDWMRREWERRQEMYRAWMEHDREHPHSDPHEHEHEHEHHHEHEQHDHHGHEHGAERGHDDHHDHHDHGPHSGGHGSQQAFERGFERGFVRGFDRATPFGPGRFAPGGFGPGGFGPGGFGRFGHGPFGPARGYGDGLAWSHGYGRPPFARRGGCGDHVRAGVDRVLSDFVERGWVWFDGDTATLTDEGRAAHDAAFERISALRASVSAGIDPADLATTLATLEAMARNLGWTPPAAEDTDGETADSETAGGEASDAETRSDDPATD